MCSSTCFCVSCNIYLWPVWLFKTLTVRIFLLPSDTLSLTELFEAYLLCFRGHFDLEWGYLQWLWFRAWKMQRGLASIAAEIRLWVCADTWTCVCVQAYLSDYTWERRVNAIGVTLRQVTFHLQAHNFPSKFFLMFPITFSPHQSSEPLCLPLADKLCSEMKGSEQSQSQRYIFKDRWWLPKKIHCKQLLMITGTYSENGVTSTWNLKKWDWRSRGV